MSEASSVNFSVSVPGKGRPDSIGRMVTLNSIVEWIRSHDLDEKTTQNLIAQASRYPSNALPLFKKNFNLMLQRARVQRRDDESIQEEPEVTENITSFEDGLNQGWQNTETKEEENAEKESSQGKSEEKESIEEVNEVEETELEDWENSSSEIKLDSDPLRGEPETTISSTVSD